MSLLLTVRQDFNYTAFNSCAVKLYVTFASCSFEQKYPIVCLLYNKKQSRIGVSTKFKLRTMALRRDMSYGYGHPKCYLGFFKLHFAFQILKTKLHILQ